MSAALERGKQQVAKIENYRYNSSICIERLGDGKLLLILRALSDPTRFAVFQCIRGCGGAAGYDTETGLCNAGAEGGAAVCEIRCKVPCAPSTLTHHLNTLRDAGMIETEKRGRVVYAKIRPDALRELTAFFSSQMK